jgi:hypothetical protein
MNTSILSAPFPAIAIINVEYLHTPGFEPKPVKINLLPSDIWGDQRPENFEQALEVIFRQLNVVDGTELISQPRFRADMRMSGYPRVRSMSVGDTVTIRFPGNRATFVCEGCGWKQLHANPSAIRA